MAASGLERRIDRHNSSLLSKVWLQKISETNSTRKESKIVEEFATLFNQRRDDDITVKDFITFDDNVTTSPGQINTDLVVWREKIWEEAIEDVVPINLDSNEGLNLEVIFDDEDHEDTDIATFG